MEDKKFLITIDGTQVGEDEEDRVSLSTFGSFYKKDNVYYITYEESAATGFEGDVTSLVIDSDRMVTVNRTGVSNTHMVIEKGIRHMSYYTTDFGDIRLGIRADKIENQLNDNGGQLKLRYTLDINSMDLTTNELNINVRLM
ncbi:MAG: DUF1934 domain-containing protein [Ruminococcaceae bacterium]|nr:DUF1934 domain-containing protein [Oscillospiraceae bacterium]